MLPISSSTSSESNNNNAAHLDQTLMTTTTTSSSNHSIPLMNPQQYLRRLQHDSFHNINVSPIIGIKHVYQKLLVHLMHARETVYLSMWCCDFTVPLHAGKSLHDWIAQACKANSKLRIHCLLHDNPLNRFPPGFIKAPTTCRYPHDQVTVMLVPMYNPSLFGYWLHGHSGINCLHQKWVLFDRTHLLFGGCDVRDLYACNYSKREPNMDGWYWSDLTLFIHRTPLSADPSDVDLFWDLPREWTDFLIASVVSRSRLSRTVGALPAPFINQYSLPFSEEAMFVHLIETSERYVYIENQYLYSSNRSSNRIMIALVARLEQAMKKQQSYFRVFIVTNWKMQDEKSMLNAWGLQSSLCSSMATLHWTKTYSWEQLEQHIWIGYLQVPSGPTPSASVTTTTATTAAAAAAAAPTATAKVAVTSAIIPIYTHTKWLCVDGASAIHSSSNLCDRSLSRDNSDTELGLVLFRQPALVEPIQQALWMTHAGPPLRDNMLQPASASASASASAFASASASASASSASTSSFGATSTSTGNVSQWSYLDLFDHLRVARQRKEAFQSFLAMDQLLPLSYLVRGTAFEIFNRYYL